MALVEADEEVDDEGEADCSGYDCVDDVGVVIDELGLVVVVVVPPSCCCCIKDD